MSILVPRSTWTDDDGSGTTGSIANNSELQKVYDNIDSVVGVVVALQGAERLYSNSGTNTNAAAATVDSFALSGLTAQDRLWVTWSLESQTQATGGPLQLYDVTDSVALTNLVSAGAGVTSGDGVMGDSILSPSQFNNHKVMSRNVPAIYSTGAISPFASAIATMTQLWTGSWTLGLRHGGVTAGGTLYWNWSVYKLLGQ